MKKNSRIYIMILIMLCMLSIFGCGTKHKDDEKENMNNGTEKNLYSRELLDISNSRSDIENIRNDEITEARIYWADEVYRTIDKEILKELVKRIEELELIEISSEGVAEEIIYGSYNLYLLNENQVVYRFVSNGEQLVIGDKYYVEKDGTNTVFDWNVIPYCRNTFWK